MAPAHPPRRRLRRAVAALSALAAVAAGVAVAPGAQAASDGQVSSGAEAASSGQEASRPAYLDPSKPVQRRVADLLARMTLKEKIGQMTQAERAAVADDPSRVAEWGLGSVLSGGGSTPAENTPAAWVEMVNEFQEQALSTRLKIPIIYGIDAVHGHGNVAGATLFPHNIGMGATRDPELAEKEGEVTAAELRATGIPWNFAPCLCVTRDERWGRSYESFGEDPALVKAMETGIEGLQGPTPDRIGPDHVLATAKHFAGDGDTAYDAATAAANEGKPWNEQKYTIDQGVTVTSREHFAAVGLAPYGPAVRTYRVGSVMPSFSSVDWTEDGVGNPVKMHANKELLTGVLKQKTKFQGFVISDWEGIHQIPDPSDPANTGLTGYKVRTAVNAGVDMFMEPNTAPEFMQLLMDEVEAGRVSEARIDDAVSRILRQKFALGLFEHPYASAGKVDEVGSAKHRAVAREAVAESQVLLKNSGNLLPLSPKSKIYVAGRNADDVGNQAGGWTITWQGVSGEGVQGTSILDGIKQVAPDAAVTFSEDASAPTDGSDVGIVVVGETPYAEGYGDVGGPECGWCTTPQQESKSLSLQPEDKAAVDKVCSAVEKCVVLVVSGRPQIITDQLGKIDALVASWLPGSEGAGVADVLFGERPFTGRLPVSWPRSANQVPVNVGDADYRPLYPFGWGLRTKVGSGPASAAALESARSKGDTELVDEIVARARDAAQASAVAGTAPADWARLIADADHALLTGDPEKAYRLLRRAAS
ncbi:glycoside hydrolase family 3 protein [Streptomyces jeddahensis]|uniref:beta-glucosidase n=1 Tax=Streptomyces jeddahensis TaxID=1716141 RepID=A0A177HXM5_9ACTN|nr:glycoside hydrolase family 3 protein [Streptomyces jeddahensis]OAH15652.1 beta-glucosidase BoGH3B precursor [Streptomyces jeddahensis]